MRRGLRSGGSVDSGSAVTRVERAFSDADRRRLEAILRASTWFMGVLEAARAVNAPEWAIGAGVIRDLVWDHLHERPLGEVKDIDLAFFDPSDLRSERDAAVEAELRSLRPDVDWDAKNQAAVHLWYERKFDHAIEPITSISDAIGRWPETATAVGLRLERSGGLTVIAPLGLSDLLGLVLRRNPRQVTREYFEQWRARKDVARRWPRVLVVGD